MKMAYLVKFAFILSLLGNGVQLEAVQLKYVATESLGGDDTSNKLKEITKLPLIAPNTSTLDKAQTLLGREHTWSPQRQTLGIIHEHSNHNAKSSLSCLPDQFACDGSRCISESFASDDSFPFTCWPPSALPMISPGTSL